MEAILGNQPSVRVWGAWAWSVVRMVVMVTMSRVGPVTLYLDRPGFGRVIACAVLWRVVMGIMTVTLTVTRGSVTQCGSR